MISRSQSVNVAVIRGGCYFVGELKVFTDSSRRQICNIAHEESICSVAQFGGYRSPCRLKRETFFLVYLHSKLLSSSSSSSIFFLSLSPSLLPATPLLSSSLIFPPFSPSVPLSLSSFFPFCPHSLSSILFIPLPPPLSLQFPVISSLSSSFSPQALTSFSSFPSPHSQSLSLSLPSLYLPFPFHLGQYAK